MLVAGWRKLEDYCLSRKLAIDRVPAANAARSLARALSLGTFAGAWLYASSSSSHPAQQRDGMSTDTNDKREGSSSGGSKRARQPISTGREYGAISRRASPPPNASSKRAMIEQALAVSPKRYKVGSCEADGSLCSADSMRLQHDGKLPYPALGDDAWTYATGEMVHSEDAQAREREARRIDEATALYGSLRAAGMRDSLASAVATQVCDSALRVLNRNMPLRDFVEAFGRHELKIEGPDDCIDLRATPIGDKRDPTEQEKAHADVRPWQPEQAKA